MSEETKQQYHLPELIAPANIPQKALDFLYLVAQVAEEVISEIEDNTLTTEKGHAIFRRITSDIRRELTAFPSGETPEEACSQCLTDFNNCHLSPQQCIANYSFCVHHCS